MPNVRELSQERRGEKECSNDVAATTNVIE